LTESTLLSAGGQKETESLCTDACSYLVKEPIKSTTRYMMISHHIHVPEGSHFPPQNLPWGVFQERSPEGRGDPHASPHRRPRVGLAIGDSVLDASVLAEQGCFKGCDAIVDQSCFHQGSLNAFMAQGRPAWRQARRAVQDLLSDPQGRLADASFRQTAVLAQEEVQMLVPATIGDYTDFYASREHATRVGAMFRDEKNALAPNWLHLPVAYHGRASSIVPSGTPVRRPTGQVAPAEAGGSPSQQASANVDFELEMAFLVGLGNDMGSQISTTAAAEHVFGLVLLNDWSARDVQKWEYVPLGPFNSKNWASTISPWVVTLDALEPFRCPAPEQSPSVLPYLQEEDRHSYDVQLEVSVQPRDAEAATTVARSNLRHLYWTMAQMVAHHTVGGCPLRAGDLLGTGTISRQGESGGGCLLEATTAGKHPLRLAGGEERASLQDGDTVVLTGACRGDGYTVGFGTCSGQLLPALGTVSA